MTTYLYRTKICNGVPTIVCVGNFLSSLVVTIQNPANVPPDLILYPGYTEKLECLSLITKFSQSYDVDNFTLTIQGIASAEEYSSALLAIEYVSTGVYPLTLENREIGVYVTSPYGNSSVELITLLNPY